MKREFLSNKNGITLIALVITIIVLLILAGVTIATLMGDNGILTRANSASVAQIEGKVHEEVKLAVQAAKIFSEEMATKTATGWLASEKLNSVKEVMEMDLTEEKGYTVTVGTGTIAVVYETNEYKKATNDTNARIEITITVSGNTFTIDEGQTPPAVDDPISDFTFNPEATARNTDKYGNVVTGYTKQTANMTTNVWRLFYQDDNYTYIITDELIGAGSYKPSDYYTGNYSSGADVSSVGQMLSPKISSLFNGDNENPNILSTAWLTDPEEWGDYANEEAIFAIGAPTTELFAASYNNSDETTNTIELDLGTNGYTENTDSNWLTSDLNDGIYNKDGSTNWWLASPTNNSSNRGLYVDVNRGCFDYYDVSSVLIAVRPIVCIPTSIFNSKYLNTVEDDTAEGMSATDIANNPTIFGKEVSNYTVDASVADSNIKWKIFYADGATDEDGNAIAKEDRHIYLIASDYIQIAKAPSKTVKVNDVEKTYSLKYKTSAPYKGWFTDIRSAYSTGSASITDSRLKALNNDYFNVANNGAGYSSTSNNMRAVAYMLDASIWNKYAMTEKSEYAIGGPTVELLFKSYNKKYNTQYKAQAPISNGYTISKDNGEKWASFYSEMFSTTDSLYVTKGIGNVQGMWLASPSYNDIFESFELLTIIDSGSVAVYQYSYTHCGFRPVVCLKSGIQLEEQEDGTYHII